jgi:DNA ligase (NAD+)
MEKLRIAVNQFYLNKYLDQPLMSDEEFDILRKEYESIDKSVKDLVEWDSEIRFENEPIEGLSKIIIEDNNLLSALNNYVFSNLESKKDFYVNLKYDGASIKAYYENGKLKNILGTPDESYGIVRTKAFWNLFPHELKDKSIKSLQGEVLVDCKVYGQLARNKANGITNSKLIDDEVENEAFIRIYRITFHDSKEFDFHRSKNALEELPIMKRDRVRLIENGVHDLSHDLVFAPAYKLNLNEIPNNALVNLEEGNFQNDGIVLYSPKGIQGFKFYYTESAVTIVKTINYDIKQNGSYAATVNFDSVILNDKNISNASAGGINNMINMKFGVGAKIKVIMANLTIPKIVEVLEPSEDYQFPKCECGHQLTKEDIFGNVLKCTNEDACSMKVNLWMREHKDYNPEGKDWKEWLKDNFLEWMNWFKVDRWDPYKKRKFRSGSDVYDGGVSEIINIIDRNSYNDFVVAIKFLFNFSDLQFANLKINARSVFEVSYGLFKNKIKEN